MRTLLIGRWGKTHAIAKALSKSRDIELHCLMDKKNNGIAALAKNYQLGDIKNIDLIEAYMDQHDIEMIVVVPAASLEKGITDYFIKKGIPAVGPSQFCTKLEGDKGFLRTLMKENNIDASPDFRIFDDKVKAKEFILNYPHPIAVKPAGITEGDGVKVMGVQLEDRKEAIEYVEECFENTIGNLASVIVEKKIEGEEYTIQFFSDGKNIVPMPATRDYKLLMEGDAGLNTPGMGSYSAADHTLPFLNEEYYNDSVKIIDDILQALREKYNEMFKGFLSGQYMITENGVKLIEINVRPGDSEILNITPILKTDFLEICKAIYAGELDKLNIEYENKATVCKYKVPEGFPTPKGNYKIRIDRQAFDRLDAELFQSSFEVGEDVYEPSPRLFAVTGMGDSIEEANEACEKGLSNIHGDNIFHRKDIGTPELTNKYKKYEFLRDDTPAISIPE